MASPANSTTSVDYLVPIQTELVEYMLVVIFIVGIFSNLANIFVFLQKDLRVNACSWYFIAVSVGHLIFFYFGCLTRIVTAWTSFDLTRTSIVFCKLRAFFLAFSLLISRHFLCMISIDRWMITSSHVWLRQLSSLKMARLMIISGTIIWFGFSLCMPVWYRIEGNRGCVGASDTAFPLFYAVYNLATILGPLVIMIFFNIFILFNTRQLTRSTVVVHSGTRTASIQGVKYRRKDLQLIRLCLIQGGVYILLTSLYAYTGTYSFFTQTMIKTHERMIIDAFISTVGINLMYSYMAVSQFIRSCTCIDDVWLFLDYILSVHVGFEKLPKRVHHGLAASLSVPLLIRHQLTHFAVFFALCCCSFAIENRQKRSLFRTDYCAVHITFSRSSCPFWRRKPSPQRKYPEETMSSFKKNHAFDVIIDIRGLRRYECEYLFITIQSRPRKTRHEWVI